MANIKRVVTSNSVTLYQNEVNPCIYEDLIFSLCDPEDTCIQRQIDKNEAIDKISSEDKKTLLREALGQILAIKQVSRNINTDKLNVAGHETTPAAAADDYADKFALGNEIFAILSSHGGRDEATSPFVTIAHTIIAFVEEDLTPDEPLPTTLDIKMTTNDNVDRPTIDFAPIENANAIKTIIKIPGTSRLSVAFQVPVNEDQGFSNRLDVDALAEAIAKAFPIFLLPIFR